MEKVIIVLLHEKKHHERHLPPHLREKKGKLASIAFPLAVSSIFTAVFAGLLFWASLPLSVVAPSSAPVWMGMAAMLQNRRR